ncbi:MAG: hypothetical protein CMH28_07200 [Micavibrio sp.]|nr:hypothetical protein [Micavibrio sp.]
MSDDAKKNLKAVRNLYAAFIVSVVLQFAPYPAISVFASILFLLVLVWAYILRAQYGPTTLVENHATYIIRTIWIFGLFLVAGMAACAAWFYYGIDPNSLLNFSQSVQSSVESGVMPDLSSAYLQLVKDNFDLIIFAVPLTLGPSLIYIGYRMFKGAIRGIKGYRIDQPQKWF